MSGIRKFLPMCVRRVPSATTPSGQRPNVGDLMKNKDMVRVVNIERLLECTVRQRASTNAVRSSHGRRSDKWSNPAVTTPATARMAMKAAANFAMRDCSASILPLMRASAPLRRLSSASNTRWLSA